jgi:cytochrome c
LYVIAIKSGWQAKDGTLSCVGPHNAGDIVMAGRFGTFELQLHFKMAHCANSGIIYHVMEESGALWATGPEI